MSNASNFLPEPPEEPDPASDADLRHAGSTLDEPDDPDALSTDTLEPDRDDDTWDPPDRLSTDMAESLGGRPEHETLDERLAQEEPEPDPLGGADSDVERQLREV